MVYYCIHLDCKYFAVYNYKEIKERKYCRIHKLEKMVNKKNKICEFSNCLSRGLFGYNKNKVYCKKHKKEYMDDLFHKTCKICFKQPSYNFDILKIPIYCNDHKLEGMVNVKYKKCKDCNKRIYKYSKTHCKDHYIKDLLEIK